MEIYKIRHILTGYFVQPSRISNCYSTLGKRGKIYEGGNMWSKIQNRTEYVFVVVNSGSNIFDDLSNRFPDLVRETNYPKKMLQIRFKTSPSDFEKVINPK